MEVMDADELGALLEECRSGMRGERVAPTFMEICGYPHLEHVSSNVLAHFLDPQGGHGLGTLFLESLLDAMGKDWSDDDLGDVAIVREATVSTGGRIDLTITTNNLLIGIENKLFAGIQNPLGAYAEGLRQKAKTDDLELVLALLSLFSEETVGAGHPAFFHLTHRDFMNKVLDRLGPRGPQADAKSVMMVFDYAESMERLHEGSMMDENVLQVFREHEESLNDLLDHVGELQQDMRHKVKRVGSMVQHGSLKENTEQWFHRQRPKLFDVLVHDVNLTPDLRMAIDARLTPKGWAISIFRRGGPTQDLEEWLRERGVSVGREAPRGRLLPGGKTRFDYHEEKGVADRLTAFFEEVGRATGSASVTSR